MIEWMLTWSKFIVCSSIWHLGNVNGHQLPLHIWRWYCLTTFQMKFETHGKLVRLIKSEIVFLCLTSWLSNKGARNDDERTQRHRVDFWSAVWLSLSSWAARQDVLPAEPAAVPAPSQVHPQVPSQVPHPKMPPKVSPQVPSSVFLLQCQLWGWGLLQLWGWWLLWP